MVYPRGTSLPDSAWYPPPVVVEPMRYQSPPVVFEGGYSRAEIRAELVPVDCDTVVADWLAAREDFRREADAYQAKHCKPAMSRTRRVFENGTWRYTGEFHTVWICDGKAMDVPNRPSGVSARQVDLQGCKPPR